MTSAEPYEALARLAERELALVSASEAPEPEALIALMDERAALVASLPARAPQAAAPALARALALQERITAELTVHAARVRRSLGNVEHGRRTMHGYAGGAPARGALDLTG